MRRKSTMDASATSPTAWRPSLQRPQRADRGRRRHRAGALARLPRSLRRVSHESRTPQSRWPRRGARKVAALLRDSPLAGTALLEAYRQHRRHHALGADPHGDRAVAEAAALLAGQHTIGSHHVQGLLGGTWPVVKAATRAIHARLGRVGRPRAPRAPRAEPGVLDRLRAMLAAECGSLPETAFALPPQLPIPVPTPTPCARVLALRDPAIRLNAALDLALRAAGRISGRNTNLRAWENLDRLVATGTGNLPWPSRAASTALLERWILAEPTGKTLDLCRRLAASANRVARYLAKYPEVAGRMHHPAVPVSVPTNYQVRNLQAEVRERRRARRRATADPLADEWRALLSLAAHRATQIAEIRAAFDQCCRDMRDPDAAPRCFAIAMQPWLDATGDALPVTLDFRVWPVERLRQQLGRPQDGPGGRQNQYCRYFLEFVGPRAPATLEAVPPLLRAYSIGMFNQSAACDPDRQAKLARPATTTGWQPALMTLALFRYAAPRDRGWSDAALKRGIVLVPIEMAHYGIATGVALFRSGMMTGARIGESLQHAASARCFHCDDDGNVWFEAEIKASASAIASSRGRKRFYCDDETVEAIQAVVAVMQRNGSPLTAIAPPQYLRERCPPDAFIYRVCGHFLDESTANACLRVLLLGCRLGAHDLRYAYAKTGRRVAPLRAVQAGLHHASPNQSRAYATPTDRAQAELVHRLAARAAPPIPPEESP